MNNNFTLTFSLFRSTPGTFRYQELDSKGEPIAQRDAVVGSLHIRKTAITGNPPAMIEVKIKGA